VSRFSTLGAAESAYKAATKQSAAMADEDVKRQYLATQQRQYDRAIQDAETQASALGNDLIALQAQRARIADARKTSHEEVQTAEVDNRAARAQLDKLRAEIRRIESSLADAGQVAPGSPKTR
jgi:chromosome segregation ATPase